MINTGRHKPGWSLEKSIDSPNILMVNIVKKLTKTRLLSQFRSKAKSMKLYQLPYSLVADIYVEDLFLIGSLVFESVWESLCKVYVLVHLTLR